MSELALQLIAENKAKHERGEDASYLDLGRCGLEELPDLSGMEWLETLVLSDWWEEFDEKKQKWVRFESQNSEGRNQLQKLPLTPLYLPKLKKLVAQGIGINDGSFLRGLDNISFLNLSRNQISDCSFLKKMTNLASLSLSHNKINEGHFFEHLTSLSSLYLSGNQISDGRFLVKLRENLTSLYLPYNKIRDWQFSEKLTNLREFYLAGNQIRDVRFLEKLKNLRILNIGDNQISDARFLKILTNLHSLDLSSNPISYFDFLKKLRHLTSLYLRNNQISDARFLENLTNLTSLDISYNQISNLCFLENLTNLTSLYLSDNRISDLTPLVPLIKGGVPVPLNEYGYGIDLYKNPLTNPPPEIVVQGNKAILSYFASLEGVKEEDRVAINEIKILLVGEGMAGKTSLLKQIKGLTFKKEESQTHGVIIEKLLFDTLPLFKKYGHLAGVTGRFWDFGGQEIMHASHQFFLSSRSVYILVLDSRTDAKKEEWLKHIEKFGENSPTIVAINKIDENRNYDVERRTLNEKFPFIGNRFHKISCAKKEGLDALAKELADLIPETEIFKTKLSPAWVAVKEQLEEETAANNYIDQQRFEAICANNQVNDKVQQKTLLKYLDNLGIALHFEALGLKNFYVLDPHWVTIGVYKIINSPSIQDGIFDESMLDYILNVEDVKKTEYDPAKEKAVVYSDAEQQYLVKIMQQFELLFEYTKGKYLVPDLLPKEPIMDYAFDESGKEHIRFVLKYDFFPPTLMPRFIIRVKQDIQEIARLWRSGVELHPKNIDAQAIVKADKSEKRIDICVYSNTMAKREYFAFILKTLKDIHHTYEKLEVKELMPVPGHFGHLVEYEELLGLENMGEDELKIGKLGKTFSVSKDFLDKLSTKQERMEEKNKQGGIHIHGPNYGNVGGNQQFRDFAPQQTPPDSTPNSPESSKTATKMDNRKFTLFLIGLAILGLIGVYAVYAVLNSPNGGKATISTDGVTVEKTSEKAENSAATATYTVQVPIKINGETPNPGQIGYMRATHAPSLTAELTSGGLFTFRGLSIPKDKVLIFELFYKDGKSAGSAQTPFVEANSNGLSVLNTVQFTGTLDKKRNQYINITVAPQFQIQNINTQGNGNKTSQEQ